MHWVGLSAAFCLLSLYAIFSGLPFLGVGIAGLAYYLAHNAAKTINPK